MLSTLWRSPAEARLRDWRNGAFRQRLRDRSSLDAKESIYPC